MNPLAIRIAANLADFKRNMEEMKAKIETTNSAMKRMSSAFEGSKVIADANAMAIAIDKLGGVTGLTDKEMRRVNTTVTEAISKYKSLGRQAPPELLALRDATIKADKPMKDLGDSSTALIGKLKGVAGALGLAFGAAAVVSGLKSLISGTLEYAETIKNTAAKMDVSMQATQRWQFAAEQTGASLDNVSASVLKLSQGLVGGDKGLEQALKAVGLSASAIRNMKPEDAFNAMTAAIAKIQDPMLQAKVTMEAFGKSGLELLPAIREGFVDVAAGAKTMSDDTIRRLDEAKTAWENFGRTITIVSGEILANAGEGFRRFFVFLEILRTQGPFAAEQWRLAMIQAGNATTELSNSAKLAAAALNKKGETVQQIAKYLGVAETSVQTYLDSLKKGPPIIDHFGGSTKNAKTEAERFAEAVQKLKDKINGVITPTKEWTTAVKQLGMTLMSLPKGPGTAASFFDQFEARNDGIRVFNQLLPTATTNVKSFFDQFEARNDVMKDVFGSKDNMQFLPTVATFDVATGKLIPAAKAAGEKVAAGFLGSLGKALEGLGGVIVGAIQGGGDVARSAFAHVGQSLGSDLGAWIQKGLGGTLGKILGGFAGPLGALLGSSLGGLVDKIFGKNQGREDAKGFAAMFGGFDALREKMLVLGEEGDRLWIALTQNTKGPEQVAATIRLIEEAFRKAEAAAAKTGETIKDTFEGPEGARGFPTRAQLQKAAAEAEEAYLYIRDSGLYTADVIEDAWQQWQDAMIASGDVTAKRMKELGAEITSLQKAVEAETPEYDAEGVRIYGVEELRNIERLAALEAEKAALNLVQIAEEEHATELASAAAALQAEKEFDAAKVRANNLDDYLKKLFTGGYEIPITFKLPNGVPGGQPSSPAPWYGAPTSGATPAPSSTKGSSAPVMVTVVSQLDGKVVAQNQVKYIPNELSFIGARR